MMKVIAILSFIATAAANHDSVSTSAPADISEPTNESISVPFDDVPYCGNVWDPTSPPDFVDNSTLADITMMDNGGAFSNNSGPVLSGTYPFGAFMTATLARAFGALGPGPQSPVQAQCLATFTLAIDPSTTNFMTPVLESDMNKSANTNFTQDSYEGYLESVMFQDLRLCPCYNMIPRAMMENLNCQPLDANGSSLSETYYYCNAVDMDAIYTAPEYGFDNESALERQMPQNRDATRIANWTGGVHTSSLFFYSRPIPARAAAYRVAIDMFSIGYGSSYVQAVIDTSWLDAVAGTFVTMAATTIAPTPAPTTAAPTTAAPTPAPTTADPTPAPTTSEPTNEPIYEPFGTPPYCGDVWDPASPPNMADPTVLATISALYPQLGGTVPYDVYIQVTMASVFGALTPSTQTEAQTQCLETLQIAIDPSTTNAMSPVIESDMTKAANSSLHYTGSFASYISGSVMFTELRLCPCYNMIPRAMMENLNCRPTASGYETLSSTYLTCNAVDMDAIYSDANYGFNNEAGLERQMPQNRDATRIANWQGALLPSSVLYRACTCAEYISARAAAYLAAIDMFDLGSGSSWVPVVFGVSWLDAVAGTFVTMPAATTTTGVPAAGSGNAPEGRYTGEGGEMGMGMGMGMGGKGMSEGGGKGMGKGMGEGGKGKGMGEGGKGMGEGGSGKGMSEGGRKGHGAQMTASFASKVNSPQGVGAMVGVIALVAGTAFVSVRRARNRAGDVESQADETTALIDGAPSPAII